MKNVSDIEYWCMERPGRQTTGINIIPYEKSPLVEIKPIPHGRISDDDAKLLVYLSRMADGDIVEIGCHRGSTTRMLAENNPRKHVHGIGWSGDPTMTKEQMDEYIDAGEIGVYARGFTNVTIHDVISWQFHLPRTTGMVFVDGDHSPHAVAMDTANILLHLKDCIVVYHDYGPDAPGWVGVNEVLHGPLAKSYRVNHITKTNCAWIEI